MTVLVLACCTTQSRDPRCKSFGGKWSNPSLATTQTADTLHPSKQYPNFSRFYFVGNGLNNHFPPYPVAAAECEQGGSATVQYTVLNDARLGSLEFVDWEGSEMFAYALADFLRQPDIRFRPWPDQATAPGKVTTMHMVFRTQANGLHSTK